MKNKKIIIIILLLLGVGFPILGADFFIGFNFFKNNLNNHAFGADTTYSISSGTAALAEEYQVKNFNSLSVELGKNLHIASLTLKLGISYETASMEMSGAADLTIPHPLQNGPNRELSQPLNDLTFKSNIFKLNIMIKTVEWKFYTNYIGFSVGVQQGNIDLLDSISVEETVAGNEIQARITNHEVRNHQFSTPVATFNLHNQLRFNRLISLNIQLEYRIATDLTMTGGDLTYTVGLKAFRAGVGLQITF
jgi:hypothetical protein